MATWCFDKSHADNCCSFAILGSLVRSLTFSFGSICFASLVQGFVCIFRFIVESAQRQRQEYQMESSGGGGGGPGDAGCCCCGGLCLCILECLAKILEPIVECLNQLALVYCGIYGYGYLESGRRVMELMRARGWTVVLNDQLSIFVLNLTTLLVGIITGFAGVLVERLYPFILRNTLMTTTTAMPMNHYHHNPIFLVPCHNQPCGPFGWPFSMVFGLDPSCLVSCEGP
jgi:Plasma-membrane choline transporter